MHTQKILLLSLFIFLPFIMLAQNELKEITNLPDQLKETSALVKINDLFYTINDSGGDPKVYAFNKNGKIIREITIEGVKNHDWEAIALSKKYLLIGDFGNNFGIRKNLAIYAIDRNNLHQKTVKTQFKIDFSYPEQTRWIQNPMKTPFDCEAMLVYNNKVHIFTKNWKDRTSTHYTLPLKNGEFEARQQEVLNTKGLVTDATRTDDLIWFIGYDNYMTMIWRYAPQTSNKLQRFDFPTSKKYQTEGIAIHNDTLFITTEKSDVDQGLYFIPVTQLQ